MVSQGGRHDTKQYTKEKKKKNNETRLGASLEELSLEIEGTVLKLTSGVCFARLICIIAGRILLRHKRYCSVEHLSGMKPSPFDGIRSAPLGLH